PVDEVIRIHRWPGHSLLALHDGILSFPLAGAVEPILMATDLFRRAFKLPRHLCKKDLDVAMDGNIRLMQWLAQFRSIHIHLNLGCKTSEGAPVETRLANVEPRAQHEQ